MRQIYIRYSDILIKHSYYSDTHSLISPPFSPNRFLPKSTRRAPFSLSTSTSSIRRSRPASLRSLSPPQPQSLTRRFSATIVDSQQQSSILSRFADDDRRLKLSPISSVHPPFTRRLKLSPLSAVHPPYQSLTTISISSFSATTTLLRLSLSQVSLISLQSLCLIPCMFNLFVICDY